MLCLVSYTIVSMWDCNSSSIAVVVVSYVRILCIGEYRLTSQRVTAGKTTSPQEPVQKCTHCLWFLFIYVLFIYFTWGGELYNQRIPSYFRNAPVQYASNHNPSLFLIQSEPWWAFQHPGHHAADWHSHANLREGEAAGNEAAFLGSCTSRSSLLLRGLHPAHSEQASNHMPASDLVFIYFHYYFWDTLIL